VKVNLVLVGFSGTGKSTVGVLVAERTGMTFVDVDAEIERRAGCTVTELFATRGEAYFRDVESALVREVAPGARQVIATGGGALLRAENRTALEARGLLVCLRATPAEIARRLAGDGSRPLLAEDEREARVQALLDARAAVYRSVRLHVDTDGRTAAEVADEVVTLWQTQDA
jgi:shikimate kinase